MKKSILRIAICFFVLIFTLAVIPSYSAAKSNKININTAGLKELTKLKGIGPALAKRVIKYRQGHGPFQKVENIMKVKGIGKKTFKVIKNKITAEPIPE
ncbi:MAG: ComEA family DNA-binding protein [Thermodesulfobacteriota bacterium]|nr:ComEA family DNA-binding protein [Thermodesulfobacteriota bacterium]